MERGFGDGSKLYQQRAKQALPLLVAMAKARCTIAYGDLAQMLDMSNARNLNYVLGAIGHELKALSRKWRARIPAINCLVINKYEKMPQRGIGFHMSPAKFKSLPRASQKEIIQTLNRDIWDYQGWDRVLRSFGLFPALPSQSMELAAMAANAKYDRGGGGEGEDHRILKEYVRKNPHTIGLSPSLSGEQEYCFHSADKVDVLFKASPTWIGVEVKGVSSDAGDIMRGVFQCVKYRALIEAEQRYEQMEVDSRVILALGGKLPEILRLVVGLLKIEVKEEVGVRRAD